MKIPKRKDLPHLGRQPQALAPAAGTVALPKFASTVRVWVYPERCVAALQHNSGAGHMVMGRPGGNENTIELECAELDSLAEHIEPTRPFPPMLKEQNIA